MVIPLTQTDNNPKMKTIFTLLLSLLYISTASADQRFTDIPLGSACKKILQIETSLGSKITKGDINTISHFTGTLNGMEPSIVYHCEQGKVSKHKIILSTKTEKEAYRIANVQSAELKKTLGEPIHDGFNLRLARSIRLGVMGGDMDYLTSVVVWGKAEKDAILVIKKTKENLWEITISRGNSKMEYILNS